MGGCIAPSTDHSPQATRQSDRAQVLTTQALATQTPARAKIESALANPSDDWSVPATPPLRQPSTADKELTTPVTSSEPAANTSTAPEPQRAQALAPLIAIDPGHGGRDVGAVHYGANGEVDYTEADINLTIGLLLRDMLVARGYRTLLTRDADHRLNDAWEDVNGDGGVDVADELQARVDAINEAGADLLLSIHMNAYYAGNGTPVGDVGGVVTFYCADRPFSDESHRFANLVQQCIVAMLAGLGHDARDRGVQEDLVLQVPGEPGSYLVLLGPETERIARPSAMPGVLSEALFLTHVREGELAQDPGVQRKLAEAYARAIDEYMATR